MDAIKVYVQKWHTHHISRKNINFFLPRHHHHLSGIKVLKRERDANSHVHTHMRNLRPPLLSKFFPLPLHRLLFCSFILCVLCFRDAYNFNRIPKKSKSNGSNGDGVDEWLTYGGVLLKLQPYQLLAVARVPSSSSSSQENMAREMRHENEMERTENVNKLIKHFYSCTQHQH